MTLCGLLHSEIHGSRLVYSSPWRIVVHYVLLRLPVPRHPPCALFRLTFIPEPFGSFLTLCKNHSFASLRCSLGYCSFYPAFAASEFPLPLLPLLVSITIPSPTHWFPNASSLCFAFHYSVFKVPSSLCALLFGAGGLKWTRTTDLTLIRRAL